MRLARQAVLGADQAIVPLPCVLEFVWVLESVYRFSSPEIGLAVRTLLNMPNVKVDAAAVVVGLQIFEAGGDFADGAIAAAGSAMGSRKFVSFDRLAVAKLQQIGVSAELLKSS